MSYDVPHMEGEAEFDLGEVADVGWPRWEVFVRQAGGLSHVYSESVHAPDVETALLNARDTYLRRIEGVSLWVTPADAVTSWESDEPESATQEEVGGAKVLWEVFVRHRRGLAHVHAGSVPATTPDGAIARARRVYAARADGASIWVVPSSRIHAADPADAEAVFAPFVDKDYRYPTYYEIPAEVGYM